MTEQHDIQVPKAQLQQMRQEMLQKVNKEKKRRQRLLSSTVLFVVLLSFVFSIRMSPTVASYMSKIPGFEPIVRMIAYDKGIEAIIDNEYFEEIHATASANGLTVTIVGVIADQSGMSIFYEVDAPVDIAKFNMPNIQLLQGGEDVSGSMSFGWYSGKPMQHVETVIEVSNNAGISYNSKDFEVIFQFDDEKQTKIQLPFTLKNEIQPEKVFTYNKEVEVNGQKFTIENVRISPLRIALDITIDPSNTMQLLEIADLKLIDENGNKWGSKRNGLINSGNIRDGHYTLHMQSNYFEQPKRLTLAIGSVYAVPKGQDFIEVDFGKQKVVSKPAYYDWPIDVNEKEVSIKASSPKYKGKTLLYKARSKGESIHSSSITFMAYNESAYTYEQAEGLTKIDINFYPNIIGELIEIPIPLNE